ncbi:hypothetical protein O4214_23615 [Rhodococcus erythropolis]|uniref:hypothetical protein n=1 Tax=Rhodococcus erythropolis TaxID=1833 RepID=UPI001E61DB14|nr:MULTISPECIES: hypothetical protein [Rhodococcus erythropolis group]MCD2107324.1 hypothetical protein [Rhodococcus qingshengii]MCZ4526981.1 hypothetical protein [Rhodococcus erythropolis]
MNKTHHRYRTLSVVAAAVGAAALVTSCSGTFDKFDDSKAYKKTETFSFARTSNGIDTLPSWVPAGATDIDEIIRTTGNERILRMKANVAEIDHNICTALPTVETRPASLSAQWWPAGIEKSSSFQCGDWYVGEKDSFVYGYRPESLGFIIDQLDKK